MKLVTTLLLASITLAYAGGSTELAEVLPLVEFIDPSHPSKDLDDATINAPDGRHVQCHLRTFGSDQIDRAKEFGMLVKEQSDLEKLIWRKAGELFPEDRFFQKCFVQYASDGASGRRTP